MAGDVSQYEWNGKGEKAKSHAPAAVLLDASHVKLESGKEHDVVDAHLPEKLEGTVTFEDVEAVLPYQHARKYEADDMWDVQPPEKERGKENDAQHHEENPRGVRYQCTRYDGQMT